MEKKTFHTQDNKRLYYKNNGDTIEISGAEPGIKRLVIPSEIEGLPVTTIGRKAFKGQKLINDLRIPEGVKDIKESAFEGCILLRYIILPDSIKNIGYMAFAECKNLSGVYISGAIRSLDGSAFYGSADNFELGVREVEKLNPMVKMSISLVGLKVTNNGNGPTKKRLPPQYRDIAPSEDLLDNIMAQTEEATPPRKRCNYKK